MVKGWDKALRTMTVGERSIIRVTDPELAYGSTGIPSLIPPNAQLEFDIEVLDAQLPTTNIDFDSLATADNTPVSITVLPKKCKIRTVVLPLRIQLTIIVLFSRERPPIFKLPMKNVKP